MYNHIFRQCRESIPAVDAARYYGAVFDQKGWAICPFHPDTHPSMSFKNGRFHCWACDASGDAVEYTQRLLGLTPWGAVRRLNTDFALQLPLRQKPDAKQAEAFRRHKEISTTYQDFQSWREKTARRLNAAYRFAHQALRDGTPSGRFPDAQAFAIQRQAVVEYLSDLLISGTLEEQMEVFRDRKEINSLCNRILNNTQTKSVQA